MATSEKINLLVLNNSVVEALAANKTVVANFASCFSEFASSAKKNCNTCREASRHGQGAYDAVIACIAGLPGSKKLLLKRLLDVNKIRIKVRKPGKQIDLTF